MIRLEVPLVGWPLRTDAFSHDEKKKKGANICVMKNLTPITRKNKEDHLHVSESADKEEKRRKAPFKRRENGCLAQEGQNQEIRSNSHQQGQPSLIEFCRAPKKEKKEHTLESERRSDRSLSSII